MNVPDSSAPATVDGWAPAAMRARTSWPRQVPMSRKMGAGDEEDEDGVLLVRRERRRG